MKMPRIDLSVLSGEALAFARQIVAGQGKNKGCLRAAKPPLTLVDAGTDRYGRLIQTPTKESGEAAYVWRMVAFVASPHSHHHCMPVMADFDLSGEYNAVRARAKELDIIVDQITSAIDKREWHGIFRWGRAMGAF